MCLLTEVIIQAKRGQLSAPYDSLKSGPYQSKVKPFFFGTGFLSATTFTSGSGASDSGGAGGAGGAGAGVGS